MNRAHSILLLAPLLAPTLALAQTRLDDSIFETLAEPEPVPAESLTRTSQRRDKRRPVPGAVWYASCDEVRLLGRAPLYRGQPGYRIEMDGDGDGVACEPYPGALEAARARQAAQRR